MIIRNKIPRFTGTKYSSIKRQLRHLWFRLRASAKPFASSGRKAFASNVPGALISHGKFGICNVYWVSTCHLVAIKRIYSLTKEASHLRSFKSWRTEGYTYSCLWHAKVASWRSIGEFDSDFTKFTARIHQLALPSSSVLFTISSHDDSINIRKYPQLEWTLTNRAQAPYSP